MPRARYIAEGGTYRVGGVSFEPGQEREVDHELADYLSNREDFVVSVEKADAVEKVDAGEDEVDSPGDDQADDDGDVGEDEGFDPSGFVDRTPMSDVVDDIHAGEVDDHLDAVQEAAERVGVQDAIGERRADLEEA